MPLDVVILGPPGAGKGTQAKRISDEMGIPNIATGDMVRAAIRDGTALGRRVKALYDAGELIPDDLVIGLIRERLADADTENGFLLDGFPRTHAQAEALDRTLEQVDRGVLSLVLEFKVPEEIAVERLLVRAREQGRTDDSPEVVRHRLAVFQEQTKPLVTYYRARGILVGIHAAGTIDEVFTEIQAVLETAAAR